MSSIIIFCSSYFQDFAVNVKKKSINFHYKHEKLQKYVIGMCFLFSSKIILSVTFETTVIKKTASDV